MTAPRTQLPFDWYPLGIPGNLEIGKDVYLDSSYAFAAFHSEESCALRLDEASGVYDCAAVISGRKGRVKVGAFTVLNGTYVICDDRVDIGAHCLLAWGVVITDNANPSDVPTATRRRALLAAAADPQRHPPSLGAASPVTIEDNVWVGFDSVILSGVTLGRGCVIGCKSVVTRDVPPYAVVSGNPAWILRYLEADDTDEVRALAVQNFSRSR